MDVYIVIKEIGNSYEQDHIICRVYDNEAAANEWIEAQKYPDKYDIEQLELETEARG